LVQAVRRFSEAALASSSSWQPQLPLELAFIELLPTEAAPDIPVASRQQLAPAQTRQQEPAPEIAAQREEPEQPLLAPAQKAEGDAALTLDAVKARWPNMVERVAQEDKNLPALLAMCKPLATEDDTLILGFDFPVLKEKFESKPEARALVGSVLTALLGTRCKVRCVVTKQYTPPPQPTLADEFYALAEELGGQVQEID